MNILQTLKAEYHITEDTPAGRIDWAINDYMKHHNLSPDDRNILILATIQEIQTA